jgi:hypothetical protein
MTMKALIRPSRVGAWGGSWLVVNGCITSSKCGYNICYMCYIYYIYMSIYQYNGITGWWFQICLLIFYPSSAKRQCPGHSRPLVLRDHGSSCSMSMQNAAMYPTEKAARQTSTELFAMASKIFKSPECWNHIGEMNRSIQHSTNIHVSAGDISRLSMQCAIKLQCHYDAPYLRRFSPPNPNQISGCSRCLKPPVFLVSAWEQLVFNHV